MTSLFWRMAAETWRLQRDMTRIALGAPMVIGLRVTKAVQDVGKPGFLDDPEWRRMVNEKIAASWDAQSALSRQWWQSAAKPGDVRGAGRLLHPYSRRVDANVRRLGRPAGSKRGR